MLNTNPKVARLIYCALPALKVVHMEGVGTRATQMLCICGWLMRVTMAYGTILFFFGTNDEYTVSHRFFLKNANYVCLKDRNKHVPLVLSSTPSSSWHIYTEQACVCRRLVYCIAPQPQLYTFSIDVMGP